jgi:hypothetical protein
MKQIWHPREPSDTEKAWFAGLFDGEGTIVIVKRYNPRKFCTRFGLRIVLYNTSLAALERVREIWNVGKVRLKSADDSRLGSKSVGIWYAGANQALWVLEHSVAYLVIKREQALVAILFQKNKRDFISVYGMGRFPAFAHNLEEKMRQAIMQLNRGAVADLQFEFPHQLKLEIKNEPEI